MSQKKHKHRKDGTHKDGQHTSAGRSPRQAGISKGTTWALLLLVAAGFVAFASEPLWNAAEEISVSGAEQVALGEELYAKNCQACHGAGAVGQDPNQRMGGENPDGTFMAPALNGTAHAWHHPEDMLLRIITKGSPAPESPMKGFEGKLSAGEIRAVLAYIQSLWPADLLARYRKMQSRNG